MKGIKKLFLGLIFLTLIGVGFKVDVKAAAVSPANITNVSISAPSSWSSTNADYTVTFSYNDDVFPAATNPANTATFTLNAGGSTLGTVNVSFEQAVAGEKKVRIGTTVFDAPTPATFPMSIAKAVAYDALGTNQSCTLSLKVEGTEKTTASLTGIPVAIEASYNNGGFPTGATAVKIKSGTTQYSAGTTYYFLPGDTKTFEEDVKPGGGYTREGWYVGGSKVATTSTYELTIPTSATTFKINYEKNDSALTINGYTGSGVVVAKGKNSTSRTYNLSGYTRGNIRKVKINNVEIGNKTLFSGADTDNTGSFQFNTTETGTPLVVEMDDGLTFEFPVRVVDTSAITFTVTDKTAYKDTTVAITPTLGGGVEPTVAYSPTSKANVYSSTQSGMTLNVTGLGAGTDNITATPTYNIEGFTNPAAVTFKLTVLESVPVEFTKNIFVNKGQTVKLKDFVSANPNTIAVTVTNNSGGLVSFTPSSGANALNTYSIKGESKGIKEKGVTITPGTLNKNKADVTVYQSPSLSVETSSGSSSSGSYTYSYKVTMPKGIYYGEDTSVWVTDLKKAILIFKGSGDDAKTKEVVLDSDWKDDSDKVAMSVTKKLDVKTLTGYLRDIGRKDEETISVYACAVNGKGNNDDTIKTETKEMKAYKISLDTNGGKTSYTVNGDSVSDYFYKIDGVEYTVVARGTGTLDKKSSVNADNATTSNGMATIVLGSSGAGVAGERRIKAAFSSSSSGGTDGPDAADGDGYDDVPKTGESKTDIWILWSVLFIAILGAGFMIWKRFGLVRAIAEAEHQEAVIQREEQVRAEKKAKEDKLNMLKELRNL